MAIKVHFNSAAVQKVEKIQKLEAVSQAVKGLYYSYRAMVHATINCNLKGLNLYVNKIKGHIETLKELGYDFPVNIPDREVTVEDIERLTETQKQYLKQSIDDLRKAVITCEDALIEGLSSWSCI